MDFYLQAQRAKVAVMTDNFNRRFWLWLLAGIGAVALAFPVDDAVDGALVVANPSSLHDVAWWCSKIGEGLVVAPRHRLLLERPAPVSGSGR